MITHSEFETILGKEISPVAFARVVQILLAAEKLTPQAVAEEIHLDARLLDSPVVCALVGSASENMALSAHLKDKVATISAALLSAAVEADTEEIWAKVSEILGPCEVIRYKMDNQLELTADDRAYIIENLK